MKAVVRVVSGYGVIVLVLLIVERHTKCLVVLFKH
nr:MAG TPA: hypothetical protein [Bacteriophage sp.]